MSEYCRQVELYVRPLEERRMVDLLEELKSGCWRRDTMVSSFYRLLCVRAWLRLEREKSNKLMETRSVIQIAVLVVFLGLVFSGPANV